MYVSLFSYPILTLTHLCPSVVFSVSWLSNIFFCFFIPGHFSCLFVTRTFFLSLSLGRSFCLSNVWFHLSLFSALGLAEHNMIQCSRVDPRSKGPSQKGYPPLMEIISRTNNLSIIHLYIGYKGLSVYGKNYASPMKSLGPKFNYICLVIFSVSLSLGCFSCLSVSRSFFLSLCPWSFFLSLCHSVIYSVSWWWHMLWLC